jgi:hypothetical protein
MTAECRAIARKPVPSAARRYRTALITAAVTGKIDVRKTAA